MKDKKEVLVAFRVTTSEKKALDKIVKKTKTNITDLFRDHVRHLVKNQAGRQGGV